MQAVPKEKKTIDRHTMPKELLSAPHLVVRNGIIAQPGEKNDYSILDVSSDPDCLVLKWHEPLLFGEVVSVIRLDTGERQAWSTEEGVYLDTRS